MKQNPAVYWRKQQQIRHLLGKTATIVSVTKVEGNKHFSGIIQVDDQTHSATIIANTKTPNTGDKVIGVLRIAKQNQDEGLIEYMIKFQLKEEVC